jgi:transcription termination/antitermination protein NusG
VQSVRWRFGAENARTEGGEALATVVARSEGGTNDLAVAGSSVAPWHVLWTNSHCEDLVSGQLATRGFHPFVPRIETWTRRAGTRRLTTVPLFPGYVFLNDALDKARHVEVRKARGVAAILGEGWDRPAVIPDAEIDAIRKVVEAHVPAFAHPHLKEGRRVRIEGGPLAGVEGVLLRVRPDKGLLVLSIDMLQRSVAVEVDCSQVVPA